MLAFWSFLLLLLVCYDFCCSQEHRSVVVSRGGFTVPFCRPLSLCGGAESRLHWLWIGFSFGSKAGINEVLMRSEHEEVLLQSFTLWFQHFGASLNITHHLHQTFVSQVDEPQSPCQGAMMVKTS